MSDRWEQVDRVYHAALQRDEAERAAYLKEACAGDDALRREVESLLQHQQGAESFLEAPAMQIAARMLDEHPNASLIGRRLGSYRVVSLLGSGGMGEVYQAQDSSLKRDVAIKVLPTAFANNEARLARFQREARMLAALNDPNIATIHGLEESDGTHYLVMELVPGETLAERLRKGPFSVDEALSVGSQIANALAAAHEKNIIHRDLKPANVKMTPEGNVKVLDFGLAKAFSPDDSGSDPSNLSTLSMAATAQGAILGTPGYMSPEQARGNPVTKATDIWSLGTVLYELLAGKPAFQGEHLTDILAAVVTKEPDWSRLPETTPPRVRTLLRRCLQKDRRERFQDATDVRIQIQESSTDSVSPFSTITTSAKKDGKRVLSWSAASSLAAAILASVVIWNLKPAATPPITRSVITLPPGQQLAGADFGSPMALSPDGTRLAYAARQGGSQQLYLREMDSQNASPISGTQGAVTPAFSPDGQWLVFFSDGKLKKVLVTGGEAFTLADARLPSGASWGGQGTIGFGNFQGPILQVSDRGGIAKPLTPFGEGNAGQIWPEFLPDGKAILFASGGEGIEVQSITTGERRNLTEGGTNPRYMLSGYLVYAQRGSLMAVPFDPQKMEIKGASVPVVQGVAESPTYGGSQYSVSDTGSLVYIAGGSQAIRRRMVWVSRNGAEHPLPAPLQAYQYVRISPDGKRVAVEFNKQIWLYDLARDTLTRLTFESSLNETPIWSSDGARIAFYSDKAPGEYNIWWQLADGGGQLERLTTSEYSNVPTSFSPRGEFLAFSENNPKTQKDIWVLRLSDRKAQLFLQSPAIEAAPAFSPDGRWIAYVSNESGRPEIYVQRYPGPGGKWQLSTDGGTEPIWNRNGRELFFRNGDKMMALDIATQTGFSAGKPRQLFEGPYLTNDWPQTNPTYDVSADGQRFLMVKPTEQASSATQINLVLNWSEELKRLAPANK